MLVAGDAFIGFVCLGSSLLAHPQRTDCPARCHDLRCSQNCITECLLLADLARHATFLLLWQNCAALPVPGVKDAGSSTMMGRGKQLQLAVAV
jgi:hypothetical protein